LLGAKLKKGKRFLKPNFVVLPKLNKRNDRYDGLICCFQVVVGRAYIEPAKIISGAYVLLDVGDAKIHIS
jgi:hypothetical protein